MTYIMVQSVTFLVEPNVVYETLYLKNWKREIRVRKKYELLLICVLDIEWLKIHSQTHDDDRRYPDNEYEIMCFRIKNKKDM